MTTYRIVRKHANSNWADIVQKSHLTLEEAKQHCQDPESSSKSCVKPENIKYTNKFGQWFDAFTKEE